MTIKSDLPQSVPVTANTSTPDSEAAQRFKAIEASIATARQHLNGLTGDPRCKATAATKLDEALMWAREALRQ